MCPGQVKRMSQEEGDELCPVQLTGETKTELPIQPSHVWFLVPIVAGGVFKREGGTQWEMEGRNCLQKLKLLGW